MNGKEFLDYLKKLPEERAIAIIDGMNKTANEMADKIIKYESVPAEPLVMPKIAEVDTSKLTRLTVVNKEAGRIIEKWDVKIDVSIQDNGRTLKIFYE